MIEEEMAVADRRIDPGLSHAHLGWISKPRIERVGRTEATAGYTKVAGLALGIDVWSANGGSGTGASDGTVRTDLKTAVAPYAERHEQPLVNRSGRTQAILLVLLNEGIVAVEKYLAEELPYAAAQIARLRSSVPAAIVTLSLEGSRTSVQLHSFLRFSPVQSEHTTTK
jgi:hypothetical protein